MKGRKVRKNQKLSGNYRTYMKIKDVQESIILTLQQRQVSLNLHWL